MCENDVHLNKDVYVTILIANYMCENDVLLNKDVYVTILIANYMCENDVLLNKDVYVTILIANYMCENKNLPPVPITELTSNHKEADQRITYHVVYSSQQDHNVCIVVNGSHVYILPLFVVAYCTGIIYFRQGAQTGKQGIIYHNVTGLAKCTKYNVYMFLT